MKDDDDTSNFGDGDMLSMGSSELVDDGDDDDDVWDGSIVRDTSSFASILGSTGWASPICAEMVSMSDVGGDDGVISTPTASSTSAAGATAAGATAAGSGTKTQLT